MCVYIRFQYCLIWNYIHMIYSQSNNSISWFQSPWSSFSVLLSWITFIFVTTNHHVCLLISQIQAPSFYPINSSTGIRCDTWHLCFCPLKANFGVRITVIINSVFKAADHTTYALVRTWTGVTRLRSKTTALLSWQSFKVAMPLSSEASCYTTSILTHALKTLQCFSHCLPPFLNFATRLGLSVISDISLILRFGAKHFLQLNRHSQLITTEFRFDWQCR